MGRIPSKSRRGLADALEQANKRVEHLQAVWGKHDERVASIRELNRYTYVVQHNPNCPSPFLVRLCGSSIVIDYKPPGETADVLGYGKTFGEAAKSALDECKKRFPHRFA